MKKTVKAMIRIIGGSVLLLLGVLGLFLPILQGWLFLALGLLVIFPKDTKAGRRIRAWLTKKKGQVMERFRKRRSPPAA